MEESDQDVENCLRLVMMDLNPPPDVLEETKIAQASSIFQRIIKEKYKSGLYNTVTQKHSEYRCDSIF